MKFRKLSLLVLPIIALVLEILPGGAVLCFANPTGEPLRRAFSYFSLTPFGYANVGPLLTALLTCAILPTMLLYVLTGKNFLLKIGKGLSCVGVITSLMPLLFGIRGYSVIGAAITVALAAECACLCIETKQI